MDLIRREIVPELMDDPGLEWREHHKALRALTRINWWSGSPRILWKPIRRLAGQLNRPVRLLDIATGAGDVPVALWRRAQRANVPLELAGCDVSTRALAYASERAARAHAKVKFFGLDALNQPIPTGFDVICTSLFLHHLTTDDGVQLVKRAAAASRHLLLVNDLLRHRPAHLLAWAGTRVLSRSRIVHVDGPRSVRAAYSLPEVRRLAGAAGLVGARIERRWPCRFLLSWTPLKNPRGTGTHSLTRPGE